MSVTTPPPPERDVCVGPLDRVVADLGSCRLVNAGGAVSAVGGIRPSERVIAAMATAQRSYGDVDELNRTVGAAIAAEVGVEACLVTAGAASGVMLATAACVTGGRAALLRSAAWRRGLPRRQVVIQAHHIGRYAPAFESGGGELVAVGSAEDCDVDDLDVALAGGEAAAVGFLVHPGLVDHGLSLGQVAEVAHAHGVPVVVDAAAAVPPKRNLGALCAAGADLVAISGGKGLGGPQASGLLLGRRELVDQARRAAFPHHGLGRTAKVTREAIAGLAVAVADHLALDEPAWLAGQRAVLDRLAAAVGAEARAAGCRVEVVADEDEFLVPALVIRSQAPGGGPDLARIRADLLRGDPPIHVRHRRRFGYLMVLALGLQPGEDGIVAARLGAALRCAPRAEGIGTPGAPGLPVARS